MIGKKKNQERKIALPGGNGYFIIRTRNSSRFLLLVKKTCLSEAVLFSILFSCENSVQYETNTRDETKMQASFACSSQESFECSENLIV